MLSAVLSYWMTTLGKNFQLHAFSITSWHLLCIANTKTACVQNAAFHLLWMTFPSQCNILKFLILIPHLFSLLWASTLGTSKVDVPQSLCIYSIGPAQCLIILIIFFFFFSAQAIIWLVWSNSFLLFFQFFIHCSRMGNRTSLITSYTTLGRFCYLLGFHLCNFFTLMVSSYYKL